VIGIPSAVLRAYIRQVHRTGLIHSGERAEIISGSASTTGGPCAGAPPRWTAPIGH